MNENKFGMAYHTAHATDEDSSGINYSETFPPFSHGFSSDSEKDQGAETSDGTQVEEKASENGNRDFSSEEVRKSFVNTRDLTLEASRIESFNNMELENFAIDFGIDFLARRYGLNNVITVVNEAYEGLIKSEATPNGIQHAISTIYEKLEPDINERKKLFEEIKNDPTDLACSSAYGLRVSATLRQIDKDGKIAIYQSGKSKALFHHHALVGMQNLYLLSGATQKPNSKIFDEEHKSIDSLTNDVEKPGILDYMGGIKKLTQEKTSEAYSLLNGIKAEIDGEAKNIKEEIMNKLAANNHDLSEVGDKLYEAFSVVHNDIEASNYISEAFKALLDLKERRSVEAEAQYEEALNELYKNTVGSEKSLNWLIDIAKKLSGHEYL